jgi:hypothetical protein
MNVIYPGTLSVFLAGTIDNGDSSNWQEDLINKCKDLNVTFYNPRRKEWMQNPTSEDMEKQIKWEQEHLDKADLIVMFLLDGSKSPISLLELGLYAQSKKIFVFCNPAFYRWDNVRLTCDKYHIPLLRTNLEDAKLVIESKIADS